MSKQHISFDLETLGNNTEAPIVQIGACKFTNQGKITDKFLINIKPKSLEKYDFKVNYETLFWWSNQDVEALKSVFGEHLDNNRVSIDHALHEFTKWIKNPTQYIYWSHATFDPPILQNHYRKIVGSSPIPFRNFKDIRTLNYLSKRLGITTNIERKGIHHNALDDAIFQKEYIFEYLKHFNNE